MKYLIGCINKSLNRSNIIKTRFFLLNNNNIEDVTEKLCEGVKDIAPYKYNYGLANYPFGCGLSHYLQDSNLDKVNGLDLTNTKIIMFTLSDLKHILKVKNSFDTSIRKNLIEHMKRY